MTEYEKAWAYYLTLQHLMPMDQETFRHGWNAGVSAADAIVAERHDPCEPWLEPGDVTDRLCVQVKT